MHAEKSGQDAYLKTFVSKLMGVLPHPPSKGKPPSFSTTFPPSGTMPAFTFALTSATHFSCAIDRRKIKSSRVSSSLSDPDAVGRALRPPPLRPLPLLLVLRRLPPCSPPPPPPPSSPPLPPRVLSPAPLPCGPASRPSARVSCDCARTSAAERRSRRRYRPRSSRGASRAVEAVGDGVLLGGGLCRLALLSLCIWSRRACTWPVLRAGGPTGAAACC